MADDALGCTSWWKAAFDARHSISQSIIFMEDGEKVAKGMEIVLQERGISIHGKNKEWMQKEVSEHSDLSTKRVFTLEK